MAAGSGKNRTAPATLGELARAVLVRQLQAIRKHEPGARKGRDIEALHDMRVAVRRSRAALSLFRKSLPDDWRIHQALLGWLGNRLGPVRDLDVLIQRIEALAHRNPPLDAKQTAPLAAAADARRKQARREMIGALNSERYKTGMRAYEAFLKEDFPKDSLPIGEAAPALIEKRRRTFERAAGKLDETSPPERKHRVRILAKRYRYALEFTLAHLPSSSRRLPKALAKLQDALGAQQDAAVAKAMLEQLAEDDPALRGVVGFIERRFDRLGERESRAAFKLLGTLLAPPNPT